MTTQYIINLARERLGDIKKQRWSERRLMNIVNQGQKDICTQTRYLRREVHIPLVNSRSKFLLPVDCISIQSIKYQGNNVPLYTRMDIKEPRVPSDSPFVAIKSNLNMGSVELYPPLEELHPLVTSTDVPDMELSTVEIAPIHGVVSEAEYPVGWEVQISPEYGVITQIDNVVDIDVDGKYGEINAFTYTGAIEDIASVQGEGVTTEMDIQLTEREGLYGNVTDVRGHMVSGIYGIVSDVAFEEDTMKLYYISIPPTITSPDTALVLSDMWEDILMRYIVGTALQDDNDANNFQRGEAELAKYISQLRAMRNNSSRDFSTATLEQYTTLYRRI